MLNTLKKFKRTLNENQGGEQPTGLKGWFFSFFNSLDKINKKLEKAKNDAERVELLKEALEACNNEIIRLTNENSKLKEENDDNESIFSSSSISNQSINSKIEKRKRDIQGLINSSRKSTASLRREIKYLNKIEELQEANQLKDLEIAKLKEAQKENIPAKVINTEKLGKSIERLQALVLNKN